MDSKDATTTNVVLSDSGAQQDLSAAPVIASSPSKLKRSMTTSTSLPDASIPVKKLIYALLAISLGTVIEWFDFTSEVRERDGGSCGDAKYVSTLSRLYAS